MTESRTRINDTMEAQAGGRRRYMARDHTFVVCAYGESSYLETCLMSLLRQTVRSRILIATSTPNSHISNLADHYQIPLCVRESGEKGIAADWNYAISCAQTPLVTLAHQDDWYSPHYTEKMLAGLSRASHPLIAFSNYGEIRGTQIAETNKLLRIKRLLLMPLCLPALWESRFWRRRALSMGNPICCPSVTYMKDYLPLPIFLNNMRSNIDWQAWEKISRQKGSFVYLPQILMRHRIHNQSTTTKLIEEDGRGAEDLLILKKFWPAWMAGAIEHFYKTSERSNASERP